MRKVICFDDVLLDNRHFGVPPQESIAAREAKAVHPLQRMFLRATKKKLRKRTESVYGHTSQLPHCEANGYRFSGVYPPFQNPSSSTHILTDLLK